MKQFLPARPLLPTVLLLLLALLVRPALASHLLGGELTYRYIDNGGPAAAPLRYEITVTVYNNCSTIGNPSAPYPSATVGIYNQATGAKLVLTTVNYAGITGGSLLIQQTTLSNCISPPVPTGCTITGPSQPFKVQKFIALVNLPTQPAGQGYHVVFSESARNAGITNLVGSDGQNLELYTTMTPPTIFNRSPVFANTAVAVICANDTSYYLNNAIDADGDRLEYAFGQPYRAPLPTGTTPFNPPPTGVTYAAGFSAGAPFGTGRGAISHIDTNSGIATYGTPTPGKYSVAVDVREYRVINGVEQLIGTTRRDVQLIVATCPTVRAPQLPATAGVGALPRTYTIEAGTTLTIPITATQRDNHPLTMTASSELLDGVGGFNATLNNNPGTAIGLTGAATATGTGSVVGTFVYSASCTEARATPYDITVEVRDDGCAGKTIYDVFRVTVVNPTGPKTITGDAAVCVGNAPSSYTAGGGASGSATGVTWSVTGGTIVGSNTANPVGHNRHWHPHSTRRIARRLPHRCGDQKCDHRHGPDAGRGRQPHHLPRHQHQHHRERSRHGRHLHRDGWPGFGLGHHVCAHADHHDHLHDNERGYHDQLREHYASSRYGKPDGGSNSWPSRGHHHGPARDHRRGSGSRLHL
jgi:hypothetical protein